MAYYNEDFNLPLKRNLSNFLKIGGYQPGSVAVKSIKKKTKKKFEEQIKVEKLIKAEQQLEQQKKENDFPVDEVSLTNYVGQLDSFYETGAQREQAYELVQDLTEAVIQKEDPTTDQLFIQNFFALAVELKEVFEENYIAGILIKALVVAGKRTATGFSVTKEQSEKYLSELIKTNPVEEEEIYKSKPPVQEFVCVTKEREIIGDQNLSRIAEDKEDTYSKEDILKTFSTVFKEMTGCFATKFDRDTDTKNREKMMFIAEKYQAKQLLPCLAKLYAENAKRFSRIKEEAFCCELKQEAEEIHYKISGMEMS